MRAPDVYDVKGIDMRVVLSKPASPLYVEALPANLAYLTMVAQRQMEDGSVSPQKHPREHVPESERVHVSEPGVSFSYARQAFRATTRAGRTMTSPGSSSKRPRTAYFKLEQLGFTTALDDAKKAVKYDTANDIDDDGVLSDNDSKSGDETANE